MSDQIDVNQLSNALQQKVDLPSGKSQADIDYVVEYQRPTAANNYTWYRLYKSGWVEQGSIEQKAQTVTGADYGISYTLPVKMRDNNYTGVATASFGGGSGWNGPYFSHNSTTTTVIFSGWASGSSACTITIQSYIVYGFAEQS